MATWVAEAGSRLLEPSCGNGAILSFLSQLGTAEGVELFPEEADKARQATGSEVHTSDFFSWFTPHRRGQYDGVAGNPPYIRFGSWDEKYRLPAFDLMRSEGLNPTRLTNAWLPFVVASVAAVRDGGRVGLVLPAELLQVSYAAELRAYLIDRCSDVTVISFSDLVFPGILQEVVLLLAVKGNGPASIRTVEVADATQLNEVTLDGSAIRAPLHESEKWTKYFMSATQIEALRELRTDARLSPFSQYATVNVGVVTGRNSYFCLTDEQATDLQISDYTIPLLARSAQMSGVRFTTSDLAAQTNLGARTRLLAISPSVAKGEHPALDSYIELGELEEVHLGYKCSIRQKWWSVPSTAVPDGFMLRQISTVVRLTANQAGATSTDTVHRVFTRPGVSMGRLAVVALNSISIAMSEILGRSYGGGLLELEPSEAASLPIPNPNLVSDELIETIDRLLRQGLISEAIHAVDAAVLIEGAGFSEDQVKSARDASHRLLQRRLRRGKKALPSNRS